MDRKLATAFRRATEEGPAPPPPSSLLEASQRGDIVAAERLLSTRDCDVNVRDVEGKTPLMIAAENGDYDLVGLLLQDKRCDVNSVDSHGNGVLASVIEEGNDDIFKLLVTSGQSSLDLNVRDSRGLAPLHLAVIQGSLTMVDALTHANCDLNAQDDDGYTPLFLAAWDPFNKGLLPLLRHLVDEGANPDVCDSQGKFPVVAAWGRWDHVMCLVQGGCDINHVRINGYRLLDITCFEKNAEKRDFLLLAGARTNSSAFRSDLLTQSRRDCQQGFGSKPLSLKALSRIATRGCMRLLLRTSIGSLSIPRLLQSYLMMEEFTS